MASTKKGTANNFSVDVSALHNENTSRFVESAKRPSLKHQAKRASSCKPQAPSSKPQASSHKRQAP